MKYQLIETYTDSNGTHETYRSKKYTDKKDAVREKRVLWYYVYEIMISG
jgi:hypothetical protein